MLAEAIYIADAASGLSLDDVEAGRGTRNRDHRRSHEARPGFRELHPEFEWRAMAGMRDRLTLAASTTQSWPTLPASAVKLPQAIKNQTIFPSPIVTLKPVCLAA
jgi:hypothetical protein